MREVVFQVADIYKLEAIADFNLPADSNMKTDIPAKSHRSFAPAFETSVRSLPKGRIESIDLLRGIVMVIMVLDHVRNYFHYGTLYGDPTDLSATTPILFFTRWITYFCAPVFIFLAGTSAFLYGVRYESTKRVATFLVTRGLWLIFLELTVINFSWTFDITLGMHFFQVIWAIGISMVCLGGLVFLPKKWLLLIGFVMVCGHNLLDGIQFNGTDPLAFLWYFLHQKNFVPVGEASVIFIMYPLIPWIGVMMLGYCFGSLYQKSYDPALRRKWLLRIGIGAILLFVLLRAFNIYGDPNPWSRQDTFMFSVLSFLKTNKYPPSLLYLLMTLGPAILFLYATEHKFNAITRFFVIIGRVPLFYYIMHIYLIHLLAIVGVMMAGHPWTDMLFTTQAFMEGKLANYGYNLWVVYGVWILVIALLFPVSKWYQEYKMQNRDKWWLSYM